MKITTYPDRDALNMGLADELASSLRNALMLGNDVTMAVPGGTTPGPIFDLLSAVSIDWARIKVMLTDERWVPEDHERSNTALLRKRLLVDNAAEAQMIPLYGDGVPEDVLPSLSAAIEPRLPLSIVLLGMGGDMHTASLFPGAPGLDAALAADAPALCLLDPEGQPDRRVSLSARVLNGALDKHLVIIGPEKRAALDAAVKLTPHEAPVQAVLQNLHVHWAEQE
ncbi:MAG: 6-phosphogluconolactonase [Aliishimia sp.]